MKWSAKLKHLHAEGEKAIALLLIEEEIEKVITKIQLEVKDVPFHSLASTSAIPRTGPPISEKLTYLKAKALDSYKGRTMAVTSHSSKFWTLTHAQDHVKYTVNYPIIEFKKV